MTAIESEQDLVVLLDDDGTPTGTAPRLDVHGADTPLHQAFSVHLFDDAGREGIFYVASRGHHADIGGSVPGSAPADSTSIDEEGVLIDNVRLVSDDRFLEDELVDLLTDEDGPMRLAAVVNELTAPDQPLGRMLARAE